MQEHGNDNDRVGQELGLAMNKPCGHLRVSIDPVLGGWTCVGCHAPLAEVPLVPIALPLGKLTLWQRIRWAVRWAILRHERVSVVPFVWSLAWAKDRDSRTSTKRSVGMAEAYDRMIKAHPGPLPERVQTVNRPAKHLTDAELAKVYSSPAMRALREEEGQRAVPRIGP